MADPKHEFLRRIFDQALELPASQRAEFIELECAGDSDLKRRLIAMLAAAEGPDRFLSAPTAHSEEPPTEVGGQMAQSATAASTLFMPVTEGPGTRIGRYKLLQQIGEGGFGVVFMAEQREPVSRRVALKIIKLGMDTKQVVARFEAERQALAMMDHPNIAKVFDAGATDTGRPYFVMELVRGDPITEYCDTNNLSPKERLELFTQVCHAVQHAHQKGIIHRDIKPRNVLVTVADGRPIPKVIDFGIAKATAGRLTEKTLFTEHRALIGTPEYMSPEQAEMTGVDIDTRSDIYSLGVLLYELLTGTTPFDPKRLRSAAWGELQRIIREVEPQRPSMRVTAMQSEPEAQARDESSEPEASAPGPSPSSLRRSVASSLVLAIARRRGTDPITLSRRLRGDLDWIVMKSLEKDRTRRYDTATAFADDVRRHLAGEPVVAAPPSTVYRMRKFARRYRGTVMGISAIAAALSVGIGGTTWQWMNARSANRALTEQSSVSEDLLRRAAAAHVRGQNLTPVVSLRVTNDDGRELGEVLVDRRSPGTPENPIVTTFGPGRMVVRGMQAIQMLGQFALDSISKLEDANAGLERLSEMATRGLEEVGAVLSPVECPDASVLGYTMGLKASYEIRGEPVPSEEEVNVRALIGMAVNSAKKSVEEAYAANLGAADASLKADEYPQARGRLDACPEPLRKWEWRYLWTSAAQCFYALKNVGPLVGIPVFSSDGERFLTAEFGGPARVWDSATGRSLAVVTWDCDWRGVWDFRTGRFTSNHHAAFARDGSSVALDANDNTVIVFEVKTGNEDAILRGHENEIHSIVFSPDGSHVATASADRTACIWELVADKRHIRLDHDQAVMGVTFSPDGRRVLTACSGSARIWDAATGNQLFELEGGPIGEYSRDGTKVITGGSGIVRIWDSSSSRRLTVLGPVQGEVLEPSFSPDGSKVLTVSGPVVRLWDAVSGRQLKVLSRSSRSYAPNAVFSPDGQQVITTIGAGSERSVEAKVFEVETGTELRAFSCPVTSEIRTIYGAFSPDGTKTLMVLEEGCTRMYETRSILASSPTWSAGGAPSLNRRVEVSSAGSRVLVRDSDGSLRLWDAREGKLVTAIQSHDGDITAEAFTPDGSRFATAADDGTVRVWDSTTGGPTAVLSGHKGWVDTVVFNKVGSSILTTSNYDLTVRLWDAALGHQLAELTAAEADCAKAIFSPDGSRLAVPLWDNTVRLLDGQTGAEAVRLVGHQGEISEFTFSQDSSRIATVSKDSTWSVWDARTGGRLIRLPAAESGYTRLQLLNL